MACAGGTWGGVFLPSEPHVHCRENTENPGRVLRTGISGVWSHHLGCCISPSLQQGPGLTQIKNFLFKTPLLLKSCFWGDCSLNLLLLEHCGVCGD